MPNKPQDVAKVSQDHVHHRPISFQLSTKYAIIFDDTRTKNIRGHTKLRRGKKYQCSRAPQRSIIRIPYLKYFLYLFFVGGLLASFAFSMEFGWRCQELLLQVGQVHVAAVFAQIGGYLEQVFSAYTYQSRCLRSNLEDSRWGCHFKSRNANHGISQGDDQSIYKAGFYGHGSRSCWQVRAIVWHDTLSHPWAPCW